MNLTLAKLTAMAATMPKLEPLPTLIIDRERVYAYHARDLMPLIAEPAIYMPPLDLEAKDLRMAMQISDMEIRMPVSFPITSAIGGDLWEKPSIRLNITQARRAASKLSQALLNMTRTHNDKNFRRARYWAKVADRWEGKLRKVL